MVRPRDTSADAQERQRAALRSMTPVERLRLADAMSSDVRSLATAGVRRRHPAASDEERADALAAILLGPALASKRPGSLGRGR